MPAQVGVPVVRRRREPCPLDGGVGADAIGDPGLRRVRPVALRQGLEGLQAQQDLPSPVARDRQARQDEGAVDVAVGRVRAPPQDDAGLVGDSGPCPSPILHPGVSVLLGALAGVSFRGVAGDPLGDVLVGQAGVLGEPRGGWHRHCEQRGARKLARHIGPLSATFRSRTPATAARCPPCGSSTGPDWTCPGAWQPVPPGPPRRCAPGAAARASTPSPALTARCPRPQPGIPPCPSGRDRSVRSAHDPSGNGRSCGKSSRPAGGPWR